MKRIFVIFALGAAIFAPLQVSSAMGRLFTESVQVNPDTGEETPVAVPTEEGAAIIQAIDTAGDAAGAVGVPFASFAGEIAAGVLSLAGIILTAKYRERGAALVSVAKGVERGTTDGTIKREIMRQAVKDGTAKPIQKAVQSAT